jgi:hypothetical protein
VLAPAGNSAQILSRELPWEKGTHPSFYPETGTCRQGGRLWPPPPAAACGPPSLLLWQDRVETPCQCLRNSASPPSNPASGRSAAWLARLPWEQEVGGSNPPVPTSYFPERSFGRLLQNNPQSDVVILTIARHLLFASPCDPLRPAGYLGNSMLHQPVKLGKNGLRSSAPAIFLPILPCRC